MEKSLLTLLTFISVWVGTLAPFSGLAQTTVFSDDFSTNTNATYTSSGGISGSAWSVVTSGADWGGRRNSSPQQLELSNDISGTANANGWVLAYTLVSSFTSPYNFLLESNPGLVTWTFNMRQIRADPAGFGSTSYGVAFILAGTGATSNNSGGGYAVVLGQSGSTDPIRLIRYNNGLQGTLTNLIVSNTTGLTDFGTEYLSIKVTYDPNTDIWELFLRNDGSSAFSDPATGTLTSQGTIVENTYTGEILDILGAYWQGSTAASQTAFFDNTKVTVTSPPNLSINNVALDEGNTGTTNFTFTVSLSSPAPAGGVTFDIATADGTAQDDNPSSEDNDYVAKSLTSQTIPAGASTYSFTVLVNGDVNVEPNETFFVNITNVTGATVTDGQGQGTIQNDDFITPTFEQLGPYCVDDTPDALPTTSTNGITGTWDPTTISTASNGTTTYTFTPDAGQGASTTTMDITVNPKPTLTLTAISASTANCGSMVSVQIGVNNTFEDINSLQFSVNWDPAQLEYVSNTALQIGGGDPILGTLDVASGDFIYTWIDPAGFDGEDLANTTVILTLNFKVKGTSGTASVNVTGSPTPMEVANSSFCIATPSADNFVMIGLLNNTALVGDAEVCAGSNITLTGTGTPAAVNPYVSSNTAVATINDSGVLSGLTAGTTTITYTNANGCTATREITVNDCTVCSASLTREPGTLCVGEEGVLTVNVNDGVGNYTIAIDTDGNLATAEITNNDYEDGADILVSPTTTTTYTLISVTDNGNGNQVCNLGGAVTINVTPITEPTFFSPGTFCEGAVPTILPTTSNNGITGTWNPSSINTSTPGTYTFVFTPDPGQCADTASVKARVVAKREPAFSVKTTYCEDDTPDALPGFSLGGDTGTWSPSSINTSTAGTFTFVFTPTPGACADTASIKVTVNPKVEPVFSEITLSYCEDETSEALPAESDNNIEGTWSLATVNTSTPGTTTYIFTPASGECADTASVKITINPKVKPTFSILSTYCQGQTPANLPTTSSNGVAGTWNPSTISTATPGTITYVFTPDNAECTDTASVKVVVSQPVSVEAGTPQTICVNQTLDLSELNASITGGATSGTWSSSGTGSFTGGTAFGTATAYVPSTADKNAGTITLTLTSVDPAGPCPAVVDTVVITIRNLNCSTFPWNGGK